MSVWSNGIILDSGASGRKFDSRKRKKLFIYFVHVYMYVFIIKI